ncbi:MAG: heparinase II/III family protein [Candidatus Binatia bacterium]
MSPFGAARILFKHYYSLFGLHTLPLLTNRFLRRHFDAKRIVRLSWGRQRRGRHYSSDTIATLVGTWGAREVEAAWFAKRFPEVVERKVAAAERVCEHEFDFLGTGLTQWGNPIDWHLDVKSGHRWPVKFYTDYRGKELTPGNRVDVKIPWELSRLHHFVALGQAWWLSGERRYADECFAQWESWLRTNPWLYGVNWTSAMEAAIRAVNLLWTAALLNEAPGWTDKRRQALTRGLWQHGVYIEHNLEVGVQDGHVAAANHYLANVCGLACLGLCCPELPGASRWRMVGLKAIEQEMRRQVLPDGFFFESSTSYHRLALELLLVPAVLARRSGHEMSAAYWQRLERMSEVILYLTRPDGCVPQIGDNDDGRLLILSRYFDWPRHDHRYLLAVGAALIGRADLKGAAGDCAEEVFWLLGREGVEKFDAIEPRHSFLGPKAFPHGGVYVIRTQDDPHYALVRTASCQEGTNSAGDSTAGKLSLSRPPTAHAHNDVLSVELWVEGQPIFVDPGTYCYTGDPAARGEFLSTAGHNSALVDGREINPLRRGALFGLERDTRGRTVEWKEEPGGTCVTAEHDGYLSLPEPVTQRRKVEYLEAGQVWLIKDWLQGAGTHTVAAHWHFPFQTRPEVRVRGCGLEIQVGLTECHLRIQGANHWCHEIAQGWVSPSYGVRLPAPLLTVRLAFREACGLEMVVRPARLSGVGF